MDDNTYDLPSIQSQSNPSQNAQINTYADFGIGGSSVLGFFFCLIHLCTLGTFGNNSNLVFYALFLASVLVYHSISILKTIFPKFQVEADMVNKLILSSDFHYLLISILFFFTDISPLLYILSYLIFFFIKGMNFLFNKIIPLLSNQGFELPPVADQIIEQIESVTNLSILTQIIAYIDILLGVQLFFIFLFDFRFLTCLCFFAWIFWILAFEYANNEANARAWSTLATYLRGIAANKTESFGPKIDEMLDKFSEFGNSVSRMYPLRDLKIHLQ